MVFKNSIYLFKTPLDANYQNVYDDYSSEATYFSFLQKAFTGYKTITLSAVTSRKNVGDNFEIVVKGYDSMDLHDYNYMRFIDGNNTKLYAFILSVESVNDNQDVENGLKLGSCLLKCKLDVWTNHYLEIKQEFNNISEQRCTLDTNIYKNYPSGLKNSTYSEEVTYDLLLPRSSNASGYDRTEIVVWQVIAIKDAGKIGQTGSMVRVTSTALISGYHLFYRPFSVVTATLKGLQYADNGDFEYYFRDENNVEKSGMALSHGTGSVRLYADVKSSDAWFTTLVTSVPFFYQLSYDNTVQRFVIRIDSNAKFQYGRRIESNGSLPIAVDNSQDDAPFLSLQQSYNCSKVYSFETSKQMVLDNNLRYTDECVESEQIYYEYPFNYYSLDTNNTSIPFIGQPFSAEDFKFEVNYTKKINPDIALYNINDKTLHISVVSNEEFPVTEVALDEYLVRNTGHMINQAVQGIFGMAQNIGSGGKSLGIGLATGNPMMIASGAMQLKTAPTQVLSAGVSIATALYDKSRTPAQVRQTNGNAMTTPVLADLISIKKHTCAIPNEFITDYHINGYECFYVGSIFEIRRDCFDIDCGSLELACKISNEDKTELVNAFSQGVCRWHIASAHSQSDVARRNVLKNMNRKVYNYPISLFNQGGTQ